MERLLRMDTDEFINGMQADFRRIMGRIADAVNNAADGHVINGSEIEVRDLMAELRQTAFEKAVQMRIDSTESSFSPSEGCVGPGQTEQGPVGSQRVDGERPDRSAPGAVARRRSRERHAD